jgi:hypothetical protein
MDEHHQPPTAAAIPAEKSHGAGPVKHRRRWPWILGAVILILGAIAYYTHR